MRLFMGFFMLTFVGLFVDSVPWMEGAELSAKPCRKPALTRESSVDEMMMRRRAQAHSSVHASNLWLRVMPRYFLTGCVCVQSARV
jgi:hypothetical protein